MQLSGLADASAWTTPRSGQSAPQPWMQPSSSDYWADVIYLGRPPTFQDIAQRWLTYSGHTEADLTRPTLDAMYQTYLAYLAMYNERNGTNAAPADATIENMWVTPRSGQSAPQKWMQPSASDYWADVIYLGRPPTYQDILQRWILFGGNSESSLNQTSRDSLYQTYLAYLAMYNERNGTNAAPADASIENAWAWPRSGEAAPQPWMIPSVNSSMADILYLGRPPTFQDIFNDWYLYAGGQAVNEARWTDPQRPNEMAQFNALWSLYMHYVDEYNRLNPGANAPYMDRNVALNTPVSYNPDLIGKGGGFFGSTLGKVVLAGIGLAVGAGVGALVTGAGAAEAGAGAVMGDLSGYGAGEFVTEGMVQQAVAEGTLTAAQGASVISDIYAGSAAVVTAPLADVAQTIATNASSVIDPVTGVAPDGSVMGDLSGQGAGEFVTPQMLNDAVASGTLTPAQASSILRDISSGLQFSAKDLSNLPRPSSGTPSTGSPAPGATIPGGISPSISSLLPAGTAIARLLTGLYGATNPTLHPLTAINPATGLPYSINPATGLPYATSTGTNQNALLAVAAVALVAFSMSGKKSKSNSKHEGKK